MQIFFDVNIFSSFILFRFFGWGGEDDNFFQRLAHKVLGHMLSQVPKIFAKYCWQSFFIFSRFNIFHFSKFKFLPKYLKLLSRIFFPSVFRLTSLNIWHYLIKNRLFRIITGSYLPCICAPPKQGRHWGNSSPTSPRDSLRQGSMEISRGEGMDFPIPPEFWWSTDNLSSSAGKDWF